MDCPFLALEGAGLSLSHGREVRKWRVLLEFGCGRYLQMLGGFM